MSDHSLPAEPVSSSPNALRFTVINKFWIFEVVAFLFLLSSFIYLSYQWVSVANQQAALVDKLTQLESKQRFLDQEIQFISTQKTSSAQVMEEKTDTMFVFLSDMQSYAQRALDYFEMQEPVVALDFLRKIQTNLNKFQGKKQRSLKVVENLVNKLVSHSSMIMSFDKTKALKKIQDLQKLLENLPSHLAFRHLLSAKPLEKNDHPVKTLSLKLRFKEKVEAILAKAMLIHTSKDGQEVLPAYAYRVTKAIMLLDINLARAALIRGDAEQYQQALQRLTDNISRYKPSPPELQAVFKKLDDLGEFYSGKLLYANYKLDLNSLLEVIESMKYQLKESVKTNQAVSAEAQAGLTKITKENSSDAHLTKKQNARLSSVYENSPSTYY